MVIVKKTWRKRCRRIDRRQNPGPSPRASSGVPQLAASAEVRPVRKKDWRRCDLGSQAASSNCGENVAARQIQQDVLEFGQLPREFNNPKTETEVAEQKPAKRVSKHKQGERAQEMFQKSKASSDQILQEVLRLGRIPGEFNNPKTETEVAEEKLAKPVGKRKLRKRAQEMLQKSKASSGTSSGSSLIATSANVCAAGGGSHPAANVPHSAVSATQRTDDDHVGAATLFKRTQKVFLRSVDSLRQGRCDLGSQAACSSGDEHSTARQVLQDVLRLGRLPNRCTILRLKPKVQNTRLPKE